MDGVSNMEKFTPSHPLSTAVLFLVFNRLDTTKQVFEAIREAKPPRLYIAADGARENKNEEILKVKAVRDYIIANIDWVCDVKTLFREENLGCKYAVSDAIDWFFKQEEMGIILEDDCLPSQSFFWFCETLLLKYENENIAQISGSNCLLGKKVTNNSYYFSRFNHPVWGWATWKSSWLKYDVNMINWGDYKDTDWLKELMNDKYQVKYWHNSFNDTMNGNIDTWDYQWVFTAFEYNMLTIVPECNLISNMGFGAEATHTIDKNGLVNKYENMERSEISVSDLRHPKKILREISADNYLQKTWFTTGSFFYRIKIKINRLLRVYEK